ncbi:MAG: hypothetical protein ACXAEU_00130 [Candidatus Hodarchaeales archaeon]
MKNREIIELETLNQAMRLNPDYFKNLHFELLCASADRDDLRDKLLRILEKADQYMSELIKDIYRPILKYLAAQGVPVPESELDERFAKLHVPVNYYCLVDKGIVTITEAPRKLTSKSRVHVNEPAYYYDGE